MVMPNMARTRRRRRFAALARAVAYAAIFAVWGGLVAYFVKPQVVEKAFPALRSLRPVPPPPEAPRRPLHLDPIPLPPEPESAAPRSENPLDLVPKEQESSPTPSEAQTAQTARPTLKPLSPTFQMRDHIYRPFDQLTMQGPQIKKRETKREQPAPGEGIDVRAEDLGTKFAIDKTVRAPRIVRPLRKKGELTSEEIREEKEREEEYQWEARRRVLIRRALGTLLAILTVILFTLVKSGTWGAIRKIERQQREEEDRY